MLWSKMYWPSSEEEVPQMLRDLELCQNREPLLLVRLPGVGILVESRAQKLALRPSELEPFLPEEKTAVALPKHWGELHGSRLRPLPLLPQ